MTGPTGVTQRLRRAYDAYEMSEGFAVVVCVLTWIALFLLPRIILEDVFGMHIGVIFR